MADAAPRVVLDTNVLLAGLVSESSLSQKVVDALQDRRLIPLLSLSVIAEYRAVLFSPAIRNRFESLTTARVELALQRLRYIGETVSTVGVRFEFRRDPRDAKFIELAIAGAATYIITLDADLLSLPGGRTIDSRQYRQRCRRTEILSPREFGNRNRDLLDLD